MGCTGGKCLSAKNVAEPVPAAKVHKIRKKPAESEVMKVEVEIKINEVNGETVVKRVDQLSSCFDNLFKEDKMMKNLLCQVGAMVHASLTRHCAAEQYEALAMFKTRVMLQYWKSGQDGMLGTNIPRPFLESLDKVLTLVQRKAASMGQLSPDQHPLLFQVSLFFQHDRDDLAEAADEQRREFKEILEFLSAFFDMLQQLLAYMEGKGRKSAGRSVGLSKFCQGFKDNDVKELMDSVGCVHHAMKMTLLTGAGDRDRSDRVRRPAFIGMESVGKSSLINYLVDGTTSDLLPTGTKKETEGVALVQNGEPARLMFDDESTDTSLTDGVTNSMKEVAKRLLAAKVDDKVSLDTPMQRVITPFKYGGGRVEYLDVPGIRKNTQLDVSLSLGCCSVIVLCVNSPAMFGASLKCGKGLDAFAKMYSSLATKPKIVLAVTRPMQEDNLKYDEETFEITEPANFVEEFGQVMKTHFPECPGHKVIFADTHSLGPRTQLGEVFINRFLSLVQSFGDAGSVDPSEQLYMVKDRLVQFASTMEQTLVENFEAENFDALFEEARNQAAESLASFRHIDIAQKEWNIGPDTLTSPMKAYNDRVKHLNRFTALGFAGEAKVQSQAMGGIKLQSDILQQSRCELMKAVKVNGENAFKQVWHCMEHFPALYINGETYERFIDPRASQEMDDIMKIHLDAKAAEFAEAVAVASTTKATKSWPSKIADGQTDPKVLADDYRKWFQKSACELRGFADLKRFSWYLNGYYASVADPHQKVAFLGTPLTSKVFRLDTGEYVSEDHVGPSAVARFPDCTHKLDKFGTKVDAWISRVKCQNKADPEKGSELRDREIMLCCVEAAEEAAKALQESNVIKADNPLVVKLIDLAFAMIERLMVVYDKDEHDKNRYQWTDFANMLIKESAKGSTLAQARCCRAQLVKIADVNKLARPAQVQELVGLISTAETVLRTDAGSAGDNQRSHGQFSQMAEDLSDELVNLQSVKLNVMQSMKRNIECKVFVGSVALQDLDISPVVDVVTQEFPKLRIEENKGSWESVYHALEREQAPIAFIVRSGEIMSSEPQDEEKDVLNMMRDAPFLGVLIICSATEIGEEELNLWSQASGVQCRHMKLKFGAGQKTCSATSEDVKKACGDDLFGAVRQNLEGRSGVSKIALSKMKAAAIDKLDQFMQKKSAAQRIGPDVFYANLIKNKDLPKKTPVDFAKPLKIHLPSVQTFIQDPFLERITQDGLQTVQELPIRHFLQSIISSQIMEFGKELADKMYSTVIEKMLAVLIRDQFGIKPDKFAKLLEQYVKSPETHRPDASELQRRKGDHIPAEFLYKPNFTSMYVGGTVLATCPMLYAMLGAQLMTTGTSAGEPHRENYDELLDLAKDHYKRLRNVGSFVDDTCSVTSAKISHLSTPTASTAASSGVVQGVMIP